MKLHMNYDPKLTTLEELMRQMLKTHKIVPIEPTEEMIAAGCSHGLSANGRPIWERPYEFQAKWKYQQMLDAAPEFKLEKNHEPT